MKLNIKKTILAAVNTNPNGVDGEVLIAQIELDTGFGKGIINHIIKNLETVGVVEILNDKIKLVVK